MCYMTKCPYVPPHPWNVDFPQLMLRAKAVRFKQRGTRFRDRLLTSTDRLGKLATIPVVVQAVNKVNTTASTRAVMDTVLGVAREARLPLYDGAPFRKILEHGLVVSRNIGEPRERRPDCGIEVALEKRQQLVSNAVAREATGGVRTV